MGPESINATVNDYLRLIIVVMEELQLINPIFLEDNINEEEVII